MAGKSWIPNEYRMNRASELRAEENRRKYTTLAAENWKKARLVKRSPAYQSCKPCSKSAFHRLETWAQRDSLEIATTLTQAARDSLARRTVWKTIDNGTQTLKQKPSVSTGKNKDLVKRKSKKEVARSLSGMIKVSTILNNADTKTKSVIIETLQEESPWRVMGYLKALKDSIFPGTDKGLVANENATKSNRPPASAPSSTRVNAKDDTPSDNTSKKIIPKIPPKSAGRTSSTIQPPSLGQDRHFAPFNLQRTIISQEPEERATQTTSLTRSQLIPSKALSAHMEKTHKPAESPAAVSPKSVGQETPTAPPAQCPSLSSNSLNKQGVRSQIPAESMETCSSKSERQANNSTPSQSRSPLSLVVQADVERTQLAVDSLAKLTDEIVILQQERKLEAIRRLEETAKLQRRELSETRSKIKSSLKEEIEDNKKLETVLSKIKSIREAEEGGTNSNKQSGIACSIKNTESFVDVT